MSNEDVVMAGASKPQGQYQYLGTGKQQTQANFGINQRLHGGIFLPTTGMTKKRNFEEVVDSIYMPRPRVTINQDAENQDTRLPSPIYKPDVCYDEVMPYVQIIEPTPTPQPQVSTNPQFKGQTVEQSTKPIENMGLLYIPDEKKIESTIPSTLKNKTITIDEHF